LTRVYGRTYYSCREHAPHRRASRWLPLVRAPVGWPALTDSRGTDDTLLRGWAALGRGDWEHAQTLFNAALEHGEDPDALEGLGWAGWWLDDAATVFDARERAYRLYRQRDDRRGAARVATWLVWDYIDFRGEPAVANGWLQRAHRLLDGLAPTPEQGWLALVDGHEALMARKDPARARELAAQALAIGQSVGAPDVEMLARALEGLALVSEGKVANGMRLLDEASATATSGEITAPGAAGQTSHRLNAVGLTCCYVIFACERVRDYDRASQWCSRVKEFCQRWRFGTLFAVCRTQYAGVLLWKGAWREAEAELAAAAREITQARPGLGAGSATVRLAELRRRQGRWEEAHRLFRDAETSPLGQLGSAELALDQGDVMRASALVERYLRRFPSENQAERAAALELLVRISTAQRDHTRAAAALDDLQRLAAAAATEPLRASAHFAAGVIAAAAGAHDRARKHFEDAVDLFEHGTAPFEKARARIELARSLAASNRGDAARTEAQGAFETLTRLGATREADRAATLLRDLEVPRRGTAGTRPNIPLTRRELDVVRLIAQGMSDKEVAARLGLSEHTVHRHVSNVLTKLDLPSRAAVVAYAARHGLL
jgi:LuxR family transcriptional regulator, maltose regulon positive regulatory protein